MRNSCPRSTFRLRTISRHVCHHSIMRKLSPCPERANRAVSKANGSRSDTHWFYPLGTTLITSVTFARVIGHLCSSHRSHLQYANGGARKRNRRHHSVPPVIRVLACRVSSSLALSECSNRGTSGQRVSAGSRLRRANKTARTDRPSIRAVLSTFTPCESMMKLVACPVDAIAFLIRIVPLQQFRFHPLANPQVPKPEATHRVNHSKTQPAVQP